VGNREGVELTTRVGSKPLNCLPTGAKRATCSRSSHSAQWAKRRPVGGREAPIAAISVHCCRSYRPSRVGSRFVFPVHEIPFLDEPISDPPVNPTTQNARAFSPVLHTAGLADRFRFQERNFMTGNTNREPTREGRRTKTAMEQRLRNGSLSPATGPSLRPMPPSARGPGSRSARFALWQAVQRFDPRVVVSLHLRVPRLWGLCSVICVTGDRPFVSASLLGFCVTTGSG